MDSDPQLLDPRLRLRDPVGRPVTGRPAGRAEELTRLGARVRELRIAANLTQTQLADATGLTRSTILRFEKGQTDLGASHLQGIAKAVGVTGADLFESPTSAAS